MKTRIRSMLLAVALVPLAPAVALAGYCFELAGMPMPAAVDLVPLTASADGQVPIAGEAHGMCGPGTPASAIRGTVTSGPDGVGRLTFRFLSSGPGCSGGEAEIVLPPPYEAGTGQVRLPEGSVANVALTHDPTGNACAAVAAAAPLQTWSTLPSILNPRLNGATNPTNPPGTNPFVTQAACVPNATTLCLQGNRFRVTAIKLGPGKLRQLNQSQSTSESGIFGSDSSASSPSNLELLVKVLNACSVTNTYQVSISPLSDISYTVTVTDTQTGRVKTYLNPRTIAGGPIEDTTAFATCP